LKMKRLREALAQSEKSKKSKKSKKKKKKKKKESKHHVAKEPSDRKYGLQMVSDKAPLKAEVSVSSKVKKDVVKDEKEDRKRSRKKRVKSAEEKAALLAEMQRDAKVVDATRRVRVKKAMKEEREEEEQQLLQQNPEQVKPEFINSLNKQAYFGKDRTLGDRVNATRHTRGRE